MRKRRAHGIFVSEPVRACPWVPAVLIRGAVLQRIEPLEETSFLGPADEDAAASASGQALLPSDALPAADPVPPAHTGEAIPIMLVNGTQDGQDAQEAAAAQDADAQNPFLTPETASSRPSLLPSLQEEEEEEEAHVDLFPEPHGPSPFDGPEPEGSSDAVFHSDDDAPPPPFAPPPGLPAAPPSLVRCVTSSVLCSVLLHSSLFVFALLRIFLLL